MDIFRNVGSLPTSSCIFLYFFQFFREWIYTHEKVTSGPSYISESECFHTEIKEPVTSDPLCQITLANLIVLVQFDNVPLLKWMELEEI